MRYFYDADAPFYRPRKPSAFETLELAELDIAVEVVEALKKGQKVKVEVSVPFSLSRWIRN